jgi:type IV pilus assembly protein PilQ
MAAIHVRSGEGGTRTLGALVALALVGCALAWPGLGRAGDEGRAAIRIERDGAEMRVTLQGIHEPVYSAFLAEAPRRLVIDVDSVRPDQLGAPPGLPAGLVEDIAVSARDGGSRVELRLAANAWYDVAPSDEALTVRLAPVDAPETVTLAVADATQTELPDVSAGAAATAAAATRLLGVEAREDGGDVRIFLRADGRLDAVKTFTLANPARLVLDLEGMASDLEQSRVELGTPRAASVRIGRHPEKLRLVIDGTANGPGLEPWQVFPGDAGMTIALGPQAIAAAGADGGAAMAANEVDARFETIAARGDAAAMPAVAAAGDAPAEAAPAQAPAAPAATPDGTSVTGVELQRHADRDEVLVTGSAPLDYQLIEPDARTLVIRIPGATLAPSAETTRTFDTPGPISMVTAFQEPGAEAPEVRVVMKRAPGLSPVVARDGSTLYAQFERGPVSAAPPASAAAAEAADPASAPAAFDSGAGAGILEEGGFSQEKAYNGRRISLDFKDVDIADVLRLIAEVSDLNVIAGDEVQGNVTIRLVDVPWDQALDVILLTKGLGFVRIGNVIRIAPTAQLKQEEEARLQERRAKEKLEDLVVKLQPVNYAKVKEIESLVTRLLTPRGTVNVDERTSTVIIKDIPSVIDEATALIKSVDSQTPQVLIESKIVEARLDFGREIGSLWAFGTQRFTDAFDTSSAVKRNQGAPDFLLHDTNNVVVQNPITEIPTGFIDLAAFVLNQEANVRLLLEAAETTGEGKVISSPRVVTLDNREALIEQGVSIPFQTFENGDAQLEFIDAVLSLKVTPHITADKSIIMKVNVTRNAPDASVPTPTGSPAIAKNQASTETLVKDGQTLVIGGIYVIDKSERQSRVPYIWKVPIIGHAFRNKEIADEHRELLIFVTPRIVPQAEGA